LQPALARHDEIFKATVGPTAALSIDLPATITSQSALNHSSRSIAPKVPFSAEAKALQELSYGRVVKAGARGVLQETAPVRNGGRRAFLHVLFEELFGVLADLRGRLPPWRAILA
jgi:hypothetical protein